MVNAYDVGCECIKFQCHIVEEEMSLRKKLSRTYGRKYMGDHETL